MTLRCAQRGKRLHQSPCRTGENGCRARVSIDAGALHVKLHIEQALGPQQQLRSTGRTKAFSFPEAPIGLQQRGILRGDSTEVRTTDLLLPLDNPAQRDGQFTKNGSQGANGSEARSYFTFVVTRATGIELPIADRWFKRR